MTLAAERLAQLPPGEAGLSSEEAAERRRRFGPNDVVPPGGRAWVALARDTARDPMIWFLAVTAALYLALGETAEGVPLLIAMLPLAGMDAYLHWRTRASTEGLEGRLARSARVVRDGAEVEIPASDVVPGDLVRMAAGSPFPADGIVLSGDDLKVDQASLTGEAFPVRKRALRPTATGLPSRIPEEHWGRAGTHLLTGRATVRIVATGGDTIYGEIARVALSGAHARTPLQVALAELVWVLVVPSSILCLMLAAVRLLQGHGLLDAAVSALTLAIAAFPEEFPVVFAFFLGVGVYRLARVQALVRRAVSVENVGRVTCICSDKTGTITEGRLVLAHVHAAEGVSRTELLALAASTASAGSSDPLDLAIRAAASECGADAVRGEVLAEFPFAEERRRGTVVLHAPSGEMLAVTKGSPETLLELCAIEPEERRTWIETADRLASGGHKVVACASRPLDEAAWAGGEPDRAFHLGGLLAFEDPVREGVVAAIGACRRARIRTILVTGDHPATARAVAMEIGLSDGEPTVLEADAIAAAGSALKAEALAGVDVVARAVPAQKLALVQALQASGEIVAVTGDGVNDVPALQAADVGIAMGDRATRSAREVAAIVLLDDNFRTIVRAISEAQQLFRNLRKSFQYLLLVHIPLVVTAALIPLAGYPLLYLPIHIVWLELVIHPTALLVFQEAAPAGDPAPTRRRRRLRFFSWREWLAIALGGAFITAAVAAGYVRSVGSLHDVQHGRAMALATLTLSGAAVTAALSGLATRTARLAVLATVALTVLLVQTPASSFLLVRPLHADDWALVLAAAALAAVATSATLVRRGAATVPVRSQRASRGV